MQNYSTLQSSLDKVIGRVGLEKTIVLLESFVGNTSIKSDETEKAKLIINYMVANALKVYDLKDADFYNSKVREYKEGRMACFHLLKKYTRWSYAKIGQVFQKSERNVRYYCTKVDDLLSVPKFYPDFTRKYAELENRVIEFLGKLN